MEVPRKFFKMAVLPALFGLLLASVASGQTVDIHPQEAVVREGDDVTVLCKVAYPIDSCRLLVGGQSYILRANDQNGDVVYSGQGFQNGECGAHIKNVKNLWNGLVQCTVPPQSGSIEVSASMKLIVATPPRNPQLIPASYQSVYKEGDTFRAQCIVPEGRPAANITWFIDDQPLLSGLHQAIITGERGELQTVAQNVTLPLTANENGRTIRCRAEHEALPTPKEDRRQFSVHYPPKRDEQGPITIFGLKLGSEGRLNVTVRANPPLSNVEWTVGDQRLVPSMSSNDELVTALEPLALGGGWYNCSLMLRRIAKEDVDRSYFLRVGNDLGVEEFIVRLSTLDEPAGMELDTGAIVGIVIGVLIVLIAVFLVVFAKATDRWCFGEGARRRDHAKNSGESSDTESAVGGKVERSRLAELTARVRAVLPKSKDKVQATEAGQQEGDEKPLSDDKKGVVYAELALGEGARDKPPPASTEYAEIVYTSQPPTEAPPPAPESKES